MSFFLSYSCDSNSVKLLLKSHYQIVIDINEIQKKTRSEKRFRVDVPVNDCVSMNDRSLVNCKMMNNRCHKNACNKLLKIIHKITLLYKKCLILNYELNNCNVKNYKKSVKYFVTHDSEIVLGQLLNLPKICMKAAVGRLRQLCSMQLRNLYDGKSTLLRN